MNNNETSVSLADAGEFDTCHLLFQLLAAHAPLVLNAYGHAFNTAVGTQCLQPRSRREAAVFDATEWHLYATEKVIDENLSGFDVSHEPHRLGNVSRINRGDQAEVRSISKFESVVRIASDLHSQNRPRRPHP